MKIKSLLLGAAAGIAAMTGAQAADLPVKAKPVEYVKVCSAYGAGFYYIPGTDICLRVGGYIWSEFEVNDIGAAPTISTGAIGGDHIRNRGDNWTSFRVRNDLIMDARTNTEYGTLRSYASVGWQWTTNSGGLYQLQTPAANGNYAWYYDRAFIQFAGLTFGYVGSFFDFDPSLILNQQFSKSFKFAPAIAYTAQFGNGISGTISMEDSTTRRIGITTAVPTLLNGSAVVGGFGYFAPPAAAAGACAAGAQCGNLGAAIGTFVNGWGTTIQSGQYMPDFIVNLRVDQAWGDAQISGAVHQLKTGIVGAGTPGFTDLLGGGATAGLPWAGSKYGYAALGGLNFKLPQIAPGDSWQIESAWARGAVDYVGLSANPYSTSVSLGYRKGNFGPVIDLFDSYVNSTGQHLATAWSINTMFRHFWTPAIRSSVAFGYTKFNAPGDSQNVAGAAGSIQNFPDGKITTVALNTIWSPVKNLDLGVEGIWTRIQTDCGGLTAVGCSTDATRGRSADTIGGIFRARRDF